MDHVGWPTKYWLLSTLFITSLLIHMISSSGAIPLSLITSEVTDMPSYLTLHFWQVMFDEEANMEGEKQGRSCNPASSIGDTL